MAGGGGELNMMLCIVYVYELTNITVLAPLLHSRLRSMDVKRSIIFVTSERVVSG